MLDCPCKDHYTHTKSKNKNKNTQTKNTLSFPQNAVGLYLILFSFLRLWVVEVVVVGGGNSFDKNVTVLARKY